MENKIKSVMADVFDVSPEEIDENSSADNIENWDSLRHMNLVVALEEEFEIQLNPEDVADMLNFALVCIVVKSEAVG